MNHAFILISHCYFDSSNFLQLWRLYLWELSRSTILWKWQGWYFYINFLWSIFVQISDAKSCQTICHEYPGGVCKYFYFTPGSCQLFSEDIRYSCDVTGGAAGQSLEHCVNEVVSGCDVFSELECDYHGQVDEGLSPPAGDFRTPEECEEWCMLFQSIGCEYWIFDSSTKNCTILNSKERSCDGVTGSNYPDIDECYSSSSSPTVTTPTTTSSTTTELVTTSTTLSSTTSSSSISSTTSSSLVSKSNGFVVTGGLSKILHGDILSSVEMIEEVSPYNSCLLPDLPDERFHHTQNNLLVCGGGRFQQTTKTCSKLEETTGQWINSHNLSHPRSHHCSWQFDDKILLIGGTNGPASALASTELISEDGVSTLHYNLTYPVG